MGGRRDQIRSGLSALGKRGGFRDPIFSGESVESSSKGDCGAGEAGLPGLARVASWVAPLARFCFCRFRRAYRFCLLG